MQNECGTFQGLRVLKVHTAEYELAHDVISSNRACKENVVIILHAQPPPDISCGE